MKEWSGLGEWRFVFWEFLGGFDLGEGFLWYVVGVNLKGCVNWWRGEGFCRRFMGEKEG